MLVPIEIRGPSEDAADKVDPVVARVAEVQKAHPDLYVGSFGESTDKAAPGVVQGRPEEGRPLLRSR